MTRPASRRWWSRCRNSIPRPWCWKRRGGPELPLVAALASASLPVVVVNPRQVRDCAKATERLAETDTLDAAVLAHFAEAVRPPLRPLRDAETQDLNSLVTRRQQVVAMLVGTGGGRAGAV